MASTVNFFIVKENRGDLEEGRDFKNSDSDASELIVQLRISRRGATVGREWPSVHEGGVTESHTGPNHVLADVTCSSKEEYLPLLAFLHAFLRTSLSLLAKIWSVISLSQSLLMLWQFFKAQYTRTYIEILPPDWP